MNTRIFPRSRRKARTAYLLTQAHYAVRGRVDAALRGLSLTGLQYTVLSMVAHHPGQSSAELSRRFYRTQQAMGQLLSALEARGCFTRTEDPVNRRILRVALTDSGAALLRAADAEMDRIERALFADFSVDEIDAFRSVLEGIDDGGETAPAAVAAVAGD